MSASNATQQQEQREEMSLEQAEQVMAERVDDGGRREIKRADLTERHQVEVGDRVRSYHFPECLPDYRDPDARRYQRESYLEGRVVAIVDHPSSPCKAYKIEVERRVLHGEERDWHGHQYATPPVNGTGSWLGGVTFGVFRMDEQEEGRTDA